MKESHAKGSFLKSISDSSARGGNPLLPIPDDRRSQGKLTTINNYYSMHFSNFNKRKSIRIRIGLIVIVTDSSTY
ncbi:MAG TPA: hypothetical protein VKR53_16405 [Puia sp.]|nr:hypothetical protein [Puia sp.]